MTAHQNSCLFRTYSCVGLPWSWQRHTAGTHSCTSLHSFYSLSTHPHGLIPMVSPVSSRLAQMLSSSTDGPSLPVLLMGQQGKGLAELLLDLKSALINNDCQRRGSPKTKQVQGGFPLFKALEQTRYFLSSLQNVFCLEMTCALSAWIRSLLQLKILYFPPAARLIFSITITDLALEPWDYLPDLAEYNRAGAFPGFL